jgi:4-azaleucine resistance transporter AzlC
MASFKSRQISETLKKLSPAVPVVMGYLPVGFAYGVLAVNAGLSTVETLLMSVIVFAGSSQLMAVGFFAMGLNPVSIILTTLIVNLRHLLMSASLSPYMKPWRRLEVARFCFELTDETFAVHCVRFGNGETSARTAMAINVTCQSAWVIGTLVGVLAGNLITDIRPFALDYALPAMFIALMILQIKSRLHLWVAMLGGAASLALWGGGLKQWNVILATVAAATVGAVVETRRKKNNEIIEKACEAVDS